MKIQLNTVVSVGPRSEKLNVASNNHGCTRKCDFSVSDRSILFGQICSIMLKLSV